MVFSASIHYTIVTQLNGKRAEIFQALGFVLFSQTFLIVR